MGGSDTVANGGFDPVPTNRPVGQRYTVRCIDSPKRVFRLQHPNHPNALLTGVHYEQRFRAHFCFWTNVTKKRAQTGDPADRVYSVVLMMDWAALGDWTIAWTSPAGVWTPALANTNPHTISVTSRQSFTPIERAQDHGVEVRPPSGITTAIAWTTT
jgi:hypothetical protein